MSYLLAKYKEAGFSRPLLAADVDFLVELAPFPSGERSSSLAPEAWEEYQGWLDGVALPCLRSIQDLWDQSNPTVICSVATTRDKVEHHLSRSSVVSAPPPPVSLKTLLLTLKTLDPKPPTHFC